MTTFHSVSSERLLIGGSFSSTSKASLRSERRPSHRYSQQDLTVITHGQSLTVSSVSSWAENEWNRKAGPQMLRSRVYGKPCEILKRSPNNATYTVSFKTEDCELILDDVPRKALSF
jgi:hypothetical protein